MIRTEIPGPPATYYYSLPDMPNNKRRFMYVLTNCPWYPFAGINTDPADQNAYVHQFRTRIAQTVYFRDM